MARPIITLTTDFGSKDPYVAEMKAVILSICPDAVIVDISHQIEKFNRRMGAYVLASASPYFPDGTIHIAVVDPEVGTKRRPLCIKTRRSFFVGPDNGVLALAAGAQGMEHVYEITNSKLMMPNVSNTFHGRDIFSPAAAHLANGRLPSDFGKEMKKITVPEFAKVISEKEMLVGQVIHVDDFGNIITNIGAKDLKPMRTAKTVKLRMKNTRFTLELCRAYGEAEDQEPLAIIGSHNFLEVSINRGDASKFFKVKNGDKVILYRS
jgi:S-adenosylmethionine hydrolase